MKVNNKFDLKRLETSGNFEIYNTILVEFPCFLQNLDEGVLSNLNDSNIQNFLITIIGTDTILNNGNEFGFNENLIKVNDILIDKNLKEYTVNSVKFFEGPICNSIEIYCDYKIND